MKAPLAGTALPEALRHPENEEARWQAGSGGTRDNKHRTHCAALSRSLTTAPVGPEGAAS